MRRLHVSRDHTISFQQDISDFAHLLPRIPQELQVIALKIINATITDRSFLVRRDKLIPALQFRKENNEDYQHIVQSITVFCSNYLNWSEQFGYAEWVVLGLMVSQHVHLLNSHYALHNRQENKKWRGGV